MYSIALEALSRGSVTCFEYLTTDYQYMFGDDRSAKLLVCNVWRDAPVCSNTIDASENPHRGSECLHHWRVPGHRPGIGRSTPACRVVTSSSDARKDSGHEQEIVGLDFSCLNWSIVQATGKAHSDWLTSKPASHTGALQTRHPLSRPTALRHAVSLVSPRR